MTTQPLPFRDQSANGHPKPSTTIERRCVRCGASFRGLAPGKTGERGVWSEWAWWCSVECVVDDASAFRRSLTRCEGGDARDANA